MTTLVGTETEYAVTALDSDGRVLPLEGIVRQIGERVSRRPHLPASESGVFLANGARFYIDAGLHPEYASPETSNPWDAVRYALAGDRLMSQLAQEVSQTDHRIAELVVRKGNVDYASDTTWASHENYLHRCPVARLRPALVPHFVTRIVFTGAGGFDPFDRTCSRFVLSPRALFLRQVDALSAPGEIALVDHRDQPHCAGFHRQHVMCGDSNRSHLSMLLRMGTSALVVMLIEAGLADDNAVRLADPLGALSAVTRDVTLSRPLELVTGGHVTALETQRHFLDRARAHPSVLPAWADRLCDLWEDTLDRLERGPEAVADRLDWAIKLTAFRDRASRSGMPWPLDDSDVAAGQFELSEEADAWRAEQREIDLRYGQVYPSSLFEALEEAGVLRHGVEAIDEVDRAVSTPPAVGRARIRGKVVKRLAGRSDASSCAWDHVKDLSALTVLDLSDPFVEREVWRDLVGAQETADVLVYHLEHLLRLPGSSAAMVSIQTITERLGRARGEAPPQRSTGHAVHLNNLAFEMRNAGRFEEAESLMRAALAIDLAERHHRHPKVSHRRNNLGTLLLMQGRVAEARELVTAAWPPLEGRYDLTSARVVTIRLAIALVDDEPADLFLGQVKTHLALQPLPDFADVDRRWQMAPVLRVLAPRLETGFLELLRSIVDVANGSPRADALELIPYWRQVSAQPLDIAWPACS